MSYLDPLRLHFAGRFQVNVSTVNNDPGHFDNASFTPNEQLLQTADNMNGWFNPEGDGGWRLLGCRVTSAWLPGGPAAPDDAVLQLLVADSDSKVSAKYVDLDCEQQLVSEIWGLQVRLTDRQGQTVLRGDFEPAAFMDIWDRALGGAGGDNGAAAMHLSVLKNLQWADVSGSPFLQALQAASAASGQLSIKFNLDGVNLDYRSPDFMIGRIAGTIGPAAPGEPQHLVLGRQFVATRADNSQFFTPIGAINHCVAVVDTKTQRILIDLGNALRNAVPGGPAADIGELTLSYQDQFGTTQVLGTIPPQGPEGYTTANWYSRTAGVVGLSLWPAQLEAIAAAPLSLQGSKPMPGAPIFIAESPAFVRADTYVYRMSPGDSAQVTVYATQWGQRLAGATITLQADPSQLQPGNYSGGETPPIATPSSGLSFDASAVTGADGSATLTLRAADPGTPRWFQDGYGIDGQVYGVRPGFADPGIATTVNAWNFISVLVWSGFKPPTPVTWEAIQPVLQQYANLYPVMNRFLDLGNYDDVRAHTRLLQFSFGLDTSDPNSMPVTRDLSPAKRAAIQSWLANPVPPAGAVRAAVPVGPGPARVPATQAAQGGKAAAAARRLAPR